VLTILIVAAALGGIVLATVLLVHRYFLSPAISAATERTTADLKKVLRRTFKRPAAERPQVRVSGPKVKPIVCQICLGRVKEGLEYAKCSCGNVFHPVCLVRTGLCPYCGKAYDASMLPGMLITVPTTARSGRPNISMRWESEIQRSCPLCGRGLPDGSNECSCGAIVIEESEAFACPSCGEQVPPGRSECPGCRERFDVIASPVCPVCGRVVDEAEGVCDCGAVLGSSCPECGSELNPDDRACGKCGTIFEFV
jgi:hypothetical protein